MELSLPNLQPQVAGGLGDAVPDMVAPVASSITVQVWVEHAYVHGLPDASVLTVIGKHDRQMKDSAKFVKLMKTQHVGGGEGLSCNVITLVTSVSADRAVVCIRRKIEADNTLQEKTNMSQA